MHPALGRILHSRQRKGSSWAWPAQVIAQGGTADEIASLRGLHHRGTGACSGSSPPGVGQVACGASGGSGLQMCPQMLRITCMPLGVARWSRIGSHEKVPLSLRQQWILPTLGLLLTIVQVDISRHLRAHSLATPSSCTSATLSSQNRFVFLETCFFCFPFFLSGLFTFFASFILNFALVVDNNLTLHDVQCTYIHNCLQIADPDLV